jgi:ankyrin repeat protein
MRVMMQKQHARLRPFATLPRPPAPPLSALHAQQQDAPCVRTRLAGVPRRRCAAADAVCHAGALLAMAPSAADADALAAASAAAARLLSPLLEAAVARACGSGCAALMARRSREALRPTRAALGGADLSCHMAVACWHHLRAVHVNAAAAFADAAQLADALLAECAGDALSALVADARVAPDGTLLFTTRAAAAAAAAAGALRCQACGRAFAGTRSLRNHAQAAHAAGYGASIAAVAAAAAALQLRRRALRTPAEAAAGEALHPGLAAARDGDVAALRELHASGWDARVCEDRHGSTALLWAAGGGHLAACELLVDTAGVDAAAQQRRDGRSALHWAARNGHAAVCAWLVERCGCDAGGATHDGTNAAHWALWRGHTAVCDYLATRGDAWRARNAYGCGPAHWAALREESAAPGGACAWLHARGGVDWRAANGAGHAPLHKAAARGNAAVCAWLLGTAHAGDDGALDAPDADGNTPLALACLWGQTAAVEVLLSHGADLEAKGPVRALLFCALLRVASPAHHRSDAAADARRRAAPRRSRGRASCATMRWRRCCARAALTRSVLPRARSPRAATTRPRRTRARSRAFGSSSSVMARTKCPSRCSPS